MFPEEGQAIIAKLLFLFFVAFSMCFAKARAAEIDYSSFSTMSASLPKTVSL